MIWSRQSLSEIDFLFRDIAHLLLLKSVRPWFSALCPSSFSPPSQEGETVHDINQIGHAYTSMRPLQGRAHSVAYSNRVAATLSVNVGLYSKRRQLERHLVSGALPPEVVSLVETDVVAQHSPHYLPAFAKVNPGHLGVGEKE